MSYDEEKAGLLKKVRELEAELSFLRKTSGKDDVPLGPVALAEAVMGGPDWKARAEKAERERDDWKECAESMQQERDSVKALVAELEKEIQECRETPVIGDYSETHEAREREKVP